MARRTAFPRFGCSLKGQLGVDPLVPAYPAVTEVEERLPVDEAPRRPTTSAKISGVAAAQSGIEDQPEELLGRVSRRGPEVGAIARPNLGVAEPVRRDRKLHRVSVTVGHGILPWHRLLLI